MSASLGRSSLANQRRFISLHSHQPPFTRIRLGTARYFVAAPCDGCANRTDSLNQKDNMTGYTEEILIAVQRTRVLSDLTTGARNAGNRATALPTDEAIRLNPQDGRSTERQTTRRSRGDFDRAISGATRRYVANRRGVPPINRVSFPLQANPAGPTLDGSFISSRLPAPTALMQRWYGDFDRIETGRACIQLDRNAAMATATVTGVTTHFDRAMPTAIRNNIAGLRQPQNLA